MATITKQLILEIANECDKPYSWPDNTCVEPVIKLVKRYFTDFNMPDILQGSERQAYKLIRRKYADSWGIAGIKWLEQEKLGQIIKQPGPYSHEKPTPYKDGDIIECSYGECSRSGKPLRTIALVSTPHAYVRTRETIYPLPIDYLLVYNRARLAI